MKKPLLLAAALLLGTSAVAAALAAPHVLDHRADHAERGDHGARPAVSVGETFRLADRDHERRSEAHDRRRHAAEDDEDDDDGRAGAPLGTPAVTGPTDPATPVPDNGLFQGKARPKVEVN